PPSPLLFIFGEREGIARCVQCDGLKGTGGRLRLDALLIDSTGISVTRGATGAVDAISVRIILVRDPSMPIGYKILTGFPTLP
ncbi:MAG TPA: RNase A-like domain-containing protein, partial [Gammaproteobacteria bacterium]|nr:RNase A-like domain-containing protein [Gammaproteobacteria bacterium]